MEQTELHASLRILEEARKELTDAQEEGLQRIKQLQEITQRAVDSIEEDIKKDLEPRIEGIDTAIRTIRFQIRENERSSNLAECAKTPSRFDR